MRYYQIAPTITIHGPKDQLTYHHQSALPVGGLVTIPLGKKQAAGVILKEVAKPNFATRPVGQLIETRPLPAHLLQAALWMSRYYIAPLSSCFQTILPKGLHKTRRQIKLADTSNLINRTSFVLNSQQEAAVKTILKNSGGTTLLRGITGSGKTQVYVEVMKRTVETGRSGIVLVPEIALTAQLKSQIESSLPGAIITHSSMTEGQRHLIWRQILHSKKPVVVIGPRSALFSPITNLGLVVIDECHEPSYKQENQPRYLALRVARIITESAGARLILGSATPSVTESYLAEATAQPVALLNRPAIADALPAQISLVDIRKKDEFRRHRFLSDKLLSSIEASLGEGRQSLVFHNRRGSAPLTICQDCGWTAVCPSCQLPMTLHVDKHQLVCHICGRRLDVPASCPVCHQPQLVHRGIGTKLIADELAKLFPSAKLARFDADTAAVERLHTNYQDIYDGKFNIIIGTQMVAKGLDLPLLGSVGVVQADSGLNLPDYQANERVFQLVYQVCGRVGRLARPSSVIIQTYHPEHPSILYGSRQDYDAFYQWELPRRRQDYFPPFCYLAKLTCAYSRENQAVAASRALADGLKQRFNNQMLVLGPAPSFYEKLGGRFRWQLILKSSKRSIIQEACRELVNNSRWTVDPDPAHLL
ncbi:MAG: primosomal protein N' [Candidatus Chaera renei]|uniref:Replication restart protein PriA n=1 Tax=Candidatus Chaera renei TaxID=2506947 RepID=A0A4V1J7Q8_9BACT|nr:MAG: primosomal protein N' [Candidatus Chaera renei]